MDFEDFHDVSCFSQGGRIATLEAKLEKAREALSDIAHFGFQNTGFGHTCAKKARDALKEINDE